MKPLKVRCFFCEDLMLDSCCDSVEVSRLINTSPRIEEKKMVYRCVECKDGQKTERKRLGK